jgi:hypothetical protein
MAIDTNTIINWFKAGKKPNETQYSQTWESFWNKLEDIPQETILGLAAALGSKKDNTETIVPIDALVVSNIYTITEEDLGKTLRYSGTVDVTVLLSTNINFTTGQGVSILQTSSGRVIFATNGFVLNHSVDELPEMYGPHCMAGILITDTATPSVLIYGKLRLV